MTGVPMMDLRGQYEELRKELLEGFDAVCRSGGFILGPNVEALEAEVAAYLGAGHAVAVNSGTDALYLGLRAFDVGPGDEIITTPFTFAATAEMIHLCGATPVFVDIDPATYLLDTAQVEAAITSRTRGIIPVHLYGCPVDMSELKAIADRHGLFILEDAAQAFGASWQGKMVGVWGDVAAFSFYPTKNLGAFGDGGMVVTGDAAVAQRLRRLREHGATIKYRHEEIGINSRLDELQAVVLRLKLPKVKGWNEARRRLARMYNEKLAGVPGLTLPVEPDGGWHVFNQYTVRLKGGRRDAVQAGMADDGVASAVHYPVPLHLQPAFRGGGGLPPGGLKEAERAAEEVLSLPLWPEMTENQVDRVCAALLRHAERELVMSVPEIGSEAGSPAAAATRTEGGLSPG